MYGGVGAPSFLTITGGVQTRSTSLNTITANQKVAMAYSPTGQSGSGNGGAVLTTASAPPVGPLTTLALSGPGAASQGDIWISRIRYWPRTLANAELQTATT